MSEITIRLGEREFTVRQPALRAAKEWRSKLREPFDTILSGVSELRSLGSANLRDVSVPAVIGMVQDILPVLISAPDEIAELVLSYSPVLAAEREFIETTATDSEVLEAFVAIVRQAYPLETLTQLLGRARASTSSSSPALSGAVAKTS